MTVICAFLGGFLGIIATAGLSVFLTKRELDKKMGQTNEPEITVYHLSND